MKRIRFNPRKILELRSSHKLSQENFAKKMGNTFARQHVSNWELGKAVPNVMSLEAISNAFNVSVNYFFTETI